MPTLPASLACDARVVVSTSTAGRRLSSASSTTRASASTPRRPAGFAPAPWRHAHPDGACGSPRGPRFGDRRRGPQRAAVIVTENGIATADDAQRIAYVRDRLAQVKRALDDGVDVRGYLYWSAFDNFEWNEGYRPTFGLIGIDREHELERIVRPSAHAFGNLARSGSRCVESRRSWVRRRAVDVRLDTTSSTTDPGDLLRRRARDRVRREALHQDEPRLLPLGPLAAGVDHRPGVHLGQPRRARDPRHGGQRRAVRRLHRPLLLGRRDPGHGLPRARDDALLLRLEGAQRAGVPAPALQQADARLQLAVASRSRPC